MSKPAKTDKTDPTGPLNTEIEAITETDLIYQPVGLPKGGDSGDQSKRWRLRFDVLSIRPAKSFGLDIYSDVVLGRGGRKDEKTVDLTPFKAVEMGVSRQHLRLHMEEGRLFAVDLDSTNGTRINGLKIGKNTPGFLSDRDMLELGRLKLKVTFVSIPSAAQVSMAQMATLADALSHLAKAITSRLKLDEVMGQILEMSMALTAAGEAGIWLVDSQSGEIARVASRGIEDDAIKRMRLPLHGKSLAADVIKSGKILRKSRKLGEDQIKIKTGYLVEAVLYVPLTLGSVTFGVLEVTHRTPGDEFTEKDEKVLGAIGDFAAIAVSNARAYETSQQMVSRRTQELDTLNELILETSASLQLKDVLDKVLTHMRKQWPEHAIGLWMIDEKTELLNPHHLPGVNDDSFSLQTVTPGWGVLGNVAKHGKPLMENVAGSKRRDDGDATVTPLPRPIACVPLTLQGSGAKGLLAVLGAPGKELAQEDFDLLKSFANHVATAIDNACLYEESERERLTVRTLAESLDQPLLIVSNQGEVIISNHAATKLLQGVLEAGTSVKEAPRPVLSHILEAISDSIGQAVELTIGERIYVVSVQQKSDVGTIILMQDVTEVRQLQRLRVEVAQALSHDIRGPLTSIMGYAELLSDSSGSQDEVASISDSIRGSARRMSEMSRHLLDFAMLNETPQGNWVPVDFKDVVNDAMTDLRGVTLAKSVTIDLSVSGDPVLIEGDDNRLYRCVLNLIDNALKYAPEKSKILVGLSYKKDGVELTVRDFGPGIPEDALPRIFEKYYRAGKTGMGRTGIGLGLAMVRATAEAHRGEVSVRNPEGGGAEFTIKLPRPAAASG